jgi:multisubunit Na+/H+ antiporter MnhE subunit
VLKTVLPIRLFAISAPPLFLLWFVFAGTFAAPEMLIGAAAALVSAVALCVVQRAEPAHFRPRLYDLAQLAYVPWLLVQGTSEILYVSLRDLFGGRKAVSSFRIAHFHGGELRNPVDTARRVVALAGTTMAPNFIIFGINSQDNEMLFHQVEKSSVPQLTKNLGADA